MSEISVPESVTVKTPETQGSDDITRAKAKAALALQEAGFTQEQVKAAMAIKDAPATQEKKDVTPEKPENDEHAEKMAAIKKLKDEQSNNIGFLATGLKQSGISEQDIKRLGGDLMYAYKKGISAETIHADQSKEGGMVNMDNIDFDQLADLSKIRDSLVDLSRKNPPGIKPLSEQQALDIVSIIAKGYEAKNLAELNSTESPSPSKTTPESTEATKPYEIKGADNEGLDYLGREGAVIQFSPDNFGVLSKHLFDNLAVLKSKNISNHVTKVFMEVTNPEFIGYLTSQDATPIIEARKAGKIDPETSNLLLEQKRVADRLHYFGVDAYYFDGSSDQSQTIQKEVQDNYFNEKNKYARALVLLQENPGDDQLAEKLIKNMGGPVNMGSAVVVKS